MKTVNAVSQKSRSPFMICHIKPCKQFNLKGKLNQLLSYYKRHIDKHHDYAYIIITIYYDLYFLLLILIILV